MMYIKKPRIIEAFQYDGDLINQNGKYYVPKWAEDAHKKGIIFSKDGEMYIKTLEGNHHISHGYFVIKCIKGEIYPCKPDIFKQTYQLVEEA